MSLTQEELKAIIHYCPETGGFTWAKTRGPAIAGRIAGAKAKNGYILIGVFRTKFRAHRLAWFYVHGEWPKNYIDHKNGIRDDNRITNLREVNFSENCQNVRKAYKNNTTKALGVSHDGYGKYRARIQNNYKSTRLGLFSTKEEAHAAYVEAKRKMHSASTL